MLQESGNSHIGEAHIPLSPRPACSRLLLPAGGFQDSRCSQLGKQERGGLWREFQLRDTASPGTGFGVGRAPWACVSNKGQRAWVLWCSWVPSRALSPPGTRCPMDRAVGPERTTKSLRVQMTLVCDIDVPRMEAYITAQG